MFPMKNSILGIENLCIQPLLKRTSFFTTIFEHDLKFWIQHFYAIFGNGLSERIYWIFEYRSLHLRVLGGRSNVGNRSV